MVVIQFDWDKLGYTVSLMWGEGEVTPKSDSDPTGGQAGVDDSFGSQTYGVQDERVPSIVAVLGEPREVIDSTSGLLNGVTFVTVKYSVSGSEQGAELNKYRLYLEENEGFILLTDADFSRPSGSGVQLGRNAGTAGHAVIVELEWSNAGYIIKTSYLEGTVTANEITAPNSDGVPLMLQTLASGTYTFGYTMTVNGIEIEGFNSQQGSIYGSVIYFTIDGTEYASRTIIRDGWTYNIDMNLQTMSKSRSTAEDLEALDNNYPGFAVLSRGEGTVNGERLPYIEYGSDDGESYGKHYLKDGDVYAIEMPGDGETIFMFITGYVGEPLTGAFDIPTGFTVTEY
jgi:hypothetical protein